MINVLHLYYDLLNLYGENANIRCIKDTLEKSKINVNVDLKSLNDKIDFNKYDIIYIGTGSETNLKLALNDLLTKRDEINKYIESNKFLLLTGSSMSLFGKYIETQEEKLEGLNIFNYHAKYITTSTFKSASTTRIVGEVKVTTKLIKEKIIGFQNRCDYIYSIETPLFETEQKYSNDGTNKKEGLKYKNVYATHIIGPLLIRNPYFTDYLLKELCKIKNIKYIPQENTSKKAYKKYLENFN